MLDITITVTYFALLLGLGVLIANVCRKAKIPDAFFLLLLGFLLGPTMSNFLSKYISLNLVNVSVMGAVPDFLRILALIMIVFTGTFNLSFRTFRRFSDISVNLAIVGVIFNTLFLGVASHLILGLDWVYACLLGAILSGTEVSVLCVINDIVKTKKAGTILKIESILNAPLTVLFPVIFLDLIIMQPGALLQPMRYASQFWLMVAAGVGAGIILGLAVSKLLKAMLRKYTPLLLFAIALITYALAENIGGSGMLAVATCGLLAGKLVFKEKPEVQRFEDALSEMFRISVFTIMGAQISFTLNLYQFALSFAFFIVMFSIRPIFVMPLLGKMRYEMDRKELLLLNFAAPRGLAAAAMAPIAAMVLVNSGQKAIAEFMLNVVFLSILLSIFFSSLLAFLLREKKLEIEEEELIEYTEIRPKTKKKVKH